MKTTITDTQKKRIIVKDYKNDTLTIKGDFAPSSISAYAIYNRDNDRTYNVSMTKESATEYCEYLNEKNNTNTFYIGEITIFI